MADEQVAVENTGVDHRIALDAQQIGRFWPTCQVSVQINRISEIVGWRRKPRRPLRGRVTMSRICPSMATLRKLINGIVAALLAISSRFLDERRRFPVRLRCMLHDRFS